MSFGQARPLGNGSYRIYIQHADPWAVKALLQGTQIVSPELSTVLGFAGVPDADSELIKQFFGEGRFIVNPTDNSLIWIPKSKA